jgi:nicotinamide riboside transporter PnuC
MKDNLSPTIQDKNQLIVDLAMIIGLGGVYSTALILYNTDTNWLYTYLDGLTTALALLGNWYLTKKRLQAWPLFMSYNIIIAVLFILQGIYSLAALNLVLCCISFNGFTKWKRDLRKV